MLHETKNHYFQLLREKGTGLWIVIADSNDQRVLPDRKGSVIVNADRRTGYRTLCQLADNQSTGKEK